MTIQTPEWVKHAIFYQIFPDRFARSPRTQHPRGITFKPWGSPPEEQGYQGGDLRGIVDKLDYLQSLGITALYLNPIFASASNHRYHTFDYYQVDPLLGGNDALRELLNQAHARNMRVVLDGVFNHASRGFWAFHHILENGAHSPYVDWFTIYDWPLRPYSSTKRYPANYKAWWGLPALPVFNTNNPGVRDYIFNVARHWIEFGIDGWRLDVPAEIDDDRFWQQFRQVVKSANPEAYLCGEIWEDARRWLQGDQFDAIMNYIFMWIAISFCGAQTLRPDYKRQHLKLEPLDAPAVAREIDRMHGLYGWAVNHVQLNLLDSHDTARAVWIMGEDQSALRLCVLFQMTMPGAPCIYYGDEIGLSAGDDPYCRGAFPWHKEQEWDQELLAFYWRATALRHRYPILRTGTFHSLYAEDRVYAFSRKLDDQEAIVIFNTATSAISLSIPVQGIDATTMFQVWPEHRKRPSRVRNGHLALTLPARAAVVLISA
jgi:cyclomaltodextrinase